MPVNPGIDFKLAEEEYRKASIDSEKLKALEHMYATCPKHKGTGPILKEIKTKISKLREKIEKSRKQKSGGYSYHIKKEGAAQIVLAGITNSGKSSLLSQLTNSKPEIANYEYTTKQPEIGTMDHHGIKLQIIEFPAIFEDCSDKEKYPSYFSAIRNADLIILLLDGKKPISQQLKLIEKEFYNSFIELGGKNKENEKVIGIKTIVTVTKENKKPKTKFQLFKIERIRSEIWKNLNKIYVYTKTPGKERDFPPVALKKDSTIKELASEVHKDFVNKFRFARVWGKSTRHQGAKVGLEQKLKEQDIIELHLK